MANSLLEKCLLDLEEKGELIRITEEVDPHLEMATIHLKVHAKNGPAILFENVKGTPYRAVSNVFGSMERCRIIFNHSLEKAKRLVAIRENMKEAFRKPSELFGLAKMIYHTFPLKSGVGKFEEIQITDLPLIKCWPEDGGAFITLPQVYSEDCMNPGVKHANLGMYRIQLNGNDYVANEEIGLHYQLHRGIGIHHSRAMENGKPFKVSIFVGGHPGHAFSAVMPLPEAMSELAFAGAMSGKRFSYSRDDDYLISNDADFVIMGEVVPGHNKPEGPFGDHFGYYSLTHPFPYLKVHKVLAKKNAIWPFTVVGRPPQEDSCMGKLIHEIAGKALPSEIPGLQNLNAVDEAGVHPLLLAVANERYTPYYKENRPQEILTVANHILGKGQLSLAKYLMIATGNNFPDLDSDCKEEFFCHFLERVDFSRDLHFITNTTIDTLDYSGDGLNMGSKIIMACAQNKIRELNTVLPQSIGTSTALTELNFTKSKCVANGILIFQGPRYSAKSSGRATMEEFAKVLFAFENDLIHLPLIIVIDDEAELMNFSDFLWITFTRSNPASDIYGINSSIENKHWGCTGSLIIDARKKPHHAPPLNLNTTVENNVLRMGEKEGILHGII